MTYTIQFDSDVYDDTLPDGYMRNASGQVVQVSYCCSNFANGYDCGCAEY